MTPGKVSSRDRLIVALDVPSAIEAQKLVIALGGSVGLYKVGMQLYTAEGPKVVSDLVSSGRKVFLDLKYHDIPNTVSLAVREAARLGVSMLTVHASGGSKMLRAASDAAKGSGIMVLAVTVLTSMDEGALNQVGVSGKLLDQVLRLGGMALAEGCGGLVASAHEAAALRKQFGEGFVIVTPGVRPAGASHGDQARVVTPAAAIAAGATHVVVGRPITEAPDPGVAARDILEQMAS